MIKCIHCSKEYSAKGIGTHLWRSHGDGRDHKPSAGKPCWNKGLTAATDSRVAKITERVTATLRAKTDWPNLSEEHKAAISESMKQAHSEGRAWNIGKSRWNNEPSYPEQFFMQVIANEFEDKAYVREHSFGRFSLDFAWPHKRLCIEIDGEQHQRFADYKARDERKDAALKEAGWKVLRLIWRDVYADPKKYIQLAKEFISGRGVVVTTA